MDISRPALNCDVSGWYVRLGLVFLLVTLPLPALAEGLQKTEDSISHGAMVGQSPVIGLDQLLTLPSSRNYSVERRSGASREEWRTQFRRINEALTNERVLLEEKEKEMAKVASAKGAWNLSGPGMGGLNMDANPLDYELRASVRRGRSEIAKLERELRELEVEANIAEVPDDWR